ncbi:MAG TPA: hypothetical protein VHT00_07485 [Stellaceae bacterium]|nr:hypothetical protein [Stellaceae bacterium]
MTRNNARNIHSDQNPRRFRRKAFSRRRVSGVIRTPRKLSGGLALGVAGFR